MTVYVCAYVYVCMCYVCMYVCMNDFRLIRRSENNLWELVLSFQCVGLEALIPAWQQAPLPSELSHQTPDSQVVELQTCGTVAGNTGLRS